MYLMVHGTYYMVHDGTYLTIWYMVGTWYLTIWYMVPNYMVHGIYLYSTWYLFSLVSHL